MLMARPHDEALAGFYMNFHPVADGFCFAAQHKEHLMRMAVAMPGGLAARFEDFEEDGERHLISDWVRDRALNSCRISLIRAQSACQRLKLIRGG